MFVDEWQVFVDPSFQFNVTSEAVETLLDALGSGVRKNDAE